MTKNEDCDKYLYSGYGIGSDPPDTFSLSGDSGLGKNTIIFGVDSFSIHADNGKEGLTDGQDGSSLTGEAEYTINFSKQQEKLCLSLH